MKIIKKGTKTPPDKIVYITKCKTCGCKFIYMEKDICLGWFCEEYLKCPQCSYKVSMPTSKKKYKGDDKKKFTNDYIDNHNVKR